jgi:hypothetical protein
VRPIAQNQKAFEREVRKGTAAKDTKKNEVRRIPQGRAALREIIEG